MAQPAKRDPDSIIRSNTISVISWALGWALGITLLALTAWITDNLLIIDIGLAIVVAAVIAAGQWLAKWPLAEAKRNWIAITAAGASLVAFGAFAFINFAVRPPFSLALIPLGIVVGGIGQWIVLRRPRRLGLSRVLLSTLAWLLSTLALVMTWAVIFFVAFTYGDSHEQPPVLTFFIGMLVASLISGIIQNELLTRAFGLRQPMD